MNVVLEIAIILVLVLLNSLFAMSELAIVSARRGRLQAMQRQGSVGAGAALALAECDTDDDAAYTQAEGALVDAASALPCSCAAKRRR